MYLEYWHLNEKPFEQTLDTRFFYRSSQHQEVLARFLYVIQEDRGAAALFGVYGCGKTFVLQALIEELTRTERFRPALISHPPADGLDLLRAVTRRIQKAPLPLSRSELSADALLELIEKTLASDFQAGRKAVILLDEAHAITDDSVFEMIRQLLNLQHPRGFLLNVILAGQPEFREKLADHKALKQRVSLTYELGPFTLPETADYIKTRLSLAGASKFFFTETAVTLIHQRSSGIPRLINRLCEWALLAGMDRQVTQVDEGLIHEDVETV